MEFRFRYAQASDALSEICRLRQLFQGTRDQNAKHIKSTSSTTRSQGVLNVYHGRIKRVANRYRSARRALLALDPEGNMAAGWKRYFLELKDADIRGPDREDYEISEGRFQQSWIWTVLRPQLDPSPTIPEAQPSVSNPASLQPPGPSTSTVIPGSPAINEDEQRKFHRAHWSRAQARAERYEEEVKLTVEEMGRTLQYFKWKSSWWQSISSERSQSNNPPPPNVQSGLCAYANRQSSVYDQLTTLFVNHWRTFLSTHSLGLSWLHNYPLDAYPAPPARPRRGHRRSDASRSVVPNPPQRPASSFGPSDLASGHSTALQESTSQPGIPTSTLDDRTDAPLDSGSSDEDGDDDFTPDDSWDEDLAGDY